MDLANYLKILLYNHDAVNIPGLGTLVTQYKHAEIDESGRTMSPPSKYLTFEPNSKKKDELLINHITVTKLLNKEQAIKELKKLIDAFKNKLDQGETVLLEGIGYFSKENDVIRFEKEQDINFLTDSYGLTKIDFEPVEIDYSPFIPPVINTKPRKRYTFQIFTLTFLLIIGACVILYLNYPDLINLQTRKISQPAIRPVVDTMQEQNVKTNIDTAKKTDIEKFYESATDKKNALSIPAQKKTESFKFYIIAGSFLTYAKADILAKEIEKDGFKTQIIKFDTKYRISLGEFSDNTEALAELEKIRYSKGDNTVWLLKIPVTP